MNNIWEDKEVTRLIELFDTGLTYKEIGKELNRSEHSISYKVRKLGLNRLNRYTYTDEQFVEVCKDNISIRQVLLALGLKAAGGNYATFHANVKRLNIDVTHFKGIAANCGEHHKGGRKARPLEVYLNNEYPIHSYKLKEKLINEKLLEYKCVWCNIENMWNDKSIVLELDHIDGNNQNNNLSNLRILCPNCHSQTDTFRGRNK